MKTPSPPPAPDPKETAAAQAGLNRETAITNFGLNAVSEVSPYGGVQYEQIGTWADGTPRYQRTVSLTPTQQKMLEQQDRLGIQMNDIAGQQLTRLGGVLNQPVDLSNEAVEGRLFELGRQRLDPLMSQQEEALRTRLANQGIVSGTEAFDREMQRFQQGRNDAYTQLLLGGRQQAVQEALTERNQPINEISALMGGGQVTVPQFAPAPQVGVANTDIIGPTNLAHQTQMAGWQAGVNRQNQILGGLFGLGSAAIGGWAGSDRRIKTDVRRVGTLDNGLPVYAYRYVWGGPEQIGVMAQDVEKVKPEAVKTFNGVKHVNYAEAVR